MLTHDQRVAFIWGQFHKECSGYQSDHNKVFENYSYENTATSPRGNELIFLLHQPTHWIPISSHVSVFRLKKQQQKNRLCEINILFADQLNNLRSEP